MYANFKNFRMAAMTVLGTTAVPMNPRTKEKIPLMGVVKDRTTLGTVGSLLDHALYLGEVDFIRKCGSAGQKDKAFQTTGILHRTQKCAAHVRFNDLRESSMSPSKLW